MADTFFGLNTGDPEVESSVQVGATTNSTDLEVRVTNSDVGVTGQKITREEVQRKLDVIGEYIVSGLNTSVPVV